MIFSRLRLRTPVHDMDVERDHGQTDGLADRLGHGRMNGKGEVLGAHHHLVVHALEHDGLDHALKQTVARIHEAQILRTDDDVDRGIMAEAAVHAFKFAVAELDLPILEHDAVDDVGLADEVRDKGVFRLVVDVGRAADLLNDAVVHDDDAVAHGQRLLLIVGDVDEGDAGALLNALELDLHILAQLEVERAERLVEQQHARLADERTRDGDTLLLAAGQAGHIARLEAGKTDEREHFARFQLDLGRVHLLDVQAEGDVLRNVQMGEQGVALENGVDLAAVGGHVVQTPALEQNVAAVGLLEAADDAQGGGLAAAGRTEQGHELAAFDVERDAPEHRGPVKFFFEVMQFNQAVSQLYHSPDRMQPQTERENGSIWGGNLILLFTSYRELCEMSRKCRDTSKNGRKKRTPEDWPGRAQCAIL